MYGLPGEVFRGITHELDTTSITGIFSAVEEIFWTGGTGQILAIDDINAPSKIWMQLLTGSVPGSGETLTGSSSGAATDVASSPTERSINTPFVGASTGTALIGSYGLGLEGSDLTAADKVFDLTNTQVTPPNYVTFVVGGVVASEDYVLVAPWDGSTVDNLGNPAIQIDQLSLGTTALTTAGITGVSIEEAIPSDTPATGYIRVQDDLGFSRRLHYTSWSGSAFVVDTADGQEDFSVVNASIGNNVRISYIDKLADSSSESFTSVFGSDRDLVVIIRDGDSSPIKQFISSASLGSGGGSVTAIRTADD